MLSTLFSKSPVVRFILDQPVEHRYLPGENVKGVVELVLAEPINDVRFLTLKWEGKTQTKIDIFGSKTLQKLVEKEKILWCYGDEGSLKFLGGRSIFRFSFTIPSDSPPTYNRFCGKTKYKLTAKLSRFWRPQFVTTMNILVTCLPDPVNLHQTTSLGMVATFANTGFVFKDGIIQMELVYPRHILEPGAEFDLYARISNKSTVPIRFIFFRLVEHSHFHRYAQPIPCKTSTLCPTSQKSDRWIILSSKNKKIHQKEMSDEEYCQKLYVPEDVQPKFATSLMTVRHYVQVVVITKYMSWFHESALVKIGNGRERVKNMVA